MKIIWKKSVSSLEKVKGRDDRPDFADGISENIYKSFNDTKYLNKNSYSYKNQRMVYLNG